MIFLNAELLHVNHSQKDISGSGAPDSEMLGLRAPKQKIQGARDTPFKTLIIRTDRVRHIIADTLGAYDFLDESSLS